MQKEWSSFRITLILYLVVLILPFSFYFVYTSFQTMQTDTRIVRQSSWAAGAMGHLVLKENDQQTVMRIDKALHEISQWVTQNNDSKLYIGAQTLSKDFSQVNSCWTSYKESYLKHENTTITQHSLQCYELTDNMAITIEKMIYLKQNKIINMFYLSLTLAMILTLSLIYLVRIYIYKQMQKHIIHDHETKLFNKKYFLAELKSTAARSVRHDYPLSMLLVSIDNFEKENTLYDKKTKRQTLKRFGTLMTSLIRAGDIACRYDENHFFILLPFTERENALILKDHIHQALQKNDWIMDKKISFSFTATQLDKKETEEVFITRTLDLLT